MARLGCDGLCNLCVLAVLLCTAAAPTARARQPAPVPSDNAARPAIPAALPRGAGESLQVATAPSAPTVPPQSLSPEQRIWALEQQNAALTRRMDALINQQQSLLQRLNPPAPPIQPASTDPFEPQLLGQPRPLGFGEGQVEEDSAKPRLDLDRGVRFFSADGRYRIAFHFLTQPELRIPTPSSPSSAGTNGLVSSFDDPRTRFYFTGQVDKYFDFYTVLNRGYGSVDILDSYINFKYDKTFNVRVGRTKTPYTYEYYKIAEGDLIPPERSVFVGNLSPNRQFGVMAYGRLLNDTFEYAVAVMNGPTRSIQDYNNGKMVATYLATKPFLHGDSDLVRNLSLGGSFNIQNSNDPLEPTRLRTASDETTASAVNNLSPTFLEFNSNAKEFGHQVFWSGDIAWYYRSLTSLIMYNGGFITYSLGNRSNIRVPFEGGSAAFTYFITGEEIVSRKEIEPLRDFDARHFLSHPGAFELVTRAGLLSVGSIATETGLVDPTLWSRRALVFDNGVNWYPNRFLRISFDWQHAEFGSRVTLGGGRFTNSTDLFWFRTQIFY